MLSFATTLEFLFFEFTEFQTNFNIKCYITKIVSLVPSLHIHTIQHRKKKHEQDFLNLQY